MLWRLVVALWVAAAAVACGRGTVTDATPRCPMPDYLPVPARAWPCPPAAEVEAIRAFLAALDFCTECPEVPALGLGSGGAGR